MNVICSVIIYFLLNSISARAQISFFRRPVIAVPRQVTNGESIRGEFNSTSDYIEFFGYTAEHHNVITPDGYLLSVFRIPSEGAPILLQHGLLLASDSWVLQGPEKDLAFALADKGYDVWIADSRGNTFSKSHLRMSPKNPKFWNFSFHEMGYFDMPAVIEYILHVTNREKLDIIGHSIGATSALIMCSTKPELNEKVRSLTAIAPGIFYNASAQSNIHQILRRYEPYLKFLHAQHGVNEFFPKSSLASRVSRMLCRLDSPLYHLCIFYLQNVLGFNGLTRQQDKSALDYVKVVPRGVSYKTLLHVHQMCSTGHLSQFDYGSKSNIGIYGTRLPPMYNMSMVTAPVALVYSDGDVHVSAEDVALLKLKLRNVVANYRVDKHTFNHMDFLWGPDTREVFDFILEVLDHFDNENPTTDASVSSEINIS